jgi:hypothetical protein
MGFPQALRFSPVSVFPPILSQTNPVQLSPSYLFKIHFNTFPSTSRSSKWSLSLGSHHQHPLRTSPVSHSCHTPRPSHSSQFDHPNNIWWEVQILKLLIMYSSPLPHYLVSLRTGTGVCKCGNELQVYKMRVITLPAEELLAAQEERHAVDLQRPLKCVRKTGRCYRQTDGYMCFDTHSKPSQSATNWQLLNSAETSTEHNETYPRTTVSTPFSFLAGGGNWWGADKLRAIAGAKEPCQQKE